MNYFQLFLHNNIIQISIQSSMKYHSEQLRKHRICGGRLNKAKGRKTQSVHSCQDHSVDLYTFAGVCTDPSQLQSTVTPSMFCNPCFLWNGLLIVMETAR